MFKYITIILFAFSMVVFADEHWVNVNNPNHGDGSYSNPWNNVSYISWGAETDIILNFYPGTYTGNQISIVDGDGDKSFIRIYHCSSFAIRKEANSSGDVIFEGQSIDCGIKATPNGVGEVGLSNITITGITFQNFNKSGIKVRGWTGTDPSSQKASVINIKDCILNNNNEESILVQYVTNCSIFHNTITQQGDTESENDGIQIGDACENILIDSNYVSVENNTSTNYHIDCIQIAGGIGNTQNVTIKNNICSNNSLLSNTYEYRAGIIIDGTVGYIKIFNNLIISKKAANLINIHLWGSGTNNPVNIFNNTLIGLENQYQQMYFYKESGGSTNILNIKNNILYKKGNSNNNSLDAIKFDTGISSTEINSDIINYNLYYNVVAGTNQDVTFYFQSENPSSKSWRNYSSNNLNTDPLFTNMNDSDYTLQLHSPAKNYCNPLPEISTDIRNIIRPYWTGGLDIGAYEREEAQFRIGVVNVEGNTQINHTIQALGAYWEKDGANWSVSNASDIANSTYPTTGNSSSDQEAWDGFHLKWMKNSTNEQPFGHAFYKVTGANSYFYIDYRDAINAYSPNIYVQFDDHNNLDQKYEYYDGNTFQPITDGSILRIWQIASQGTPNTNSLSAYIPNMLVSYKEDNFPKMVWGPVVNNPGFLLERTDTIGNIAYWNLPSGTTTFIDSGVNLNAPVHCLPPPLHGCSIHAPTNLVKFQIKTSGCSSDTCSSNFVDYKCWFIGIEGDSVEQKRAFNLQKDLTFSISQNYPNPFNPTTTILFSIPKSEYVVIKLYNILGQEVKSIINEQLNPGWHNITLNASDLASGIYFYRISAGTFNQVKKMQILK